MPDNQGVATTRRRLRTELRRLREAANLHQSEVVKQLDWSISKLIRIENGSVGVSVTDVRALAGLYAADPALVEELVRLARVTRERQWWSSFRTVLAPSYRDYLGYEADASAIYQAHPTIIPGLLQTDDYLRGVIASVWLGDLSAERAEANIEVQHRRQREILYADSPVQYQVVIDEAALRRQIGGVKVMRAQLEHLAQLSEERVELRIVPFQAGGHLAMQGAFAIMEFAGEAEAGVLFLESGTGTPIQRDQDEIDLYRRGFDSLLTRSLSAVASRDLVREVADSLE
jgi:transcriptional regulator with XRE-family HTH domain